MYVVPLSATVAMDYDGIAWLTAALVVKTLCFQSAKSRCLWRELGGSP